MKTPFTWAMCLTFALAARALSGDRLVVHEWGTFTSFQNEQGEALRRINTDDEPVPAFVHELVNMPRQLRLFPPTELSLDPTGEAIKGALPTDYPVAMRLETPVIYFHLPDGRRSMELDVAVDFHRGFLTQFFPQADATVNGKPVAMARYPKGKPIVCTLRWSGVRLGEIGQVPETTDRVWLAPRMVDAAPVTIGGESEQFLFYRGVGDLESPLQVIRQGSHALDVRINAAALDQAGYSVSESSQRRLWQRIVSNRWLWLLEVRADGSSAFRRPNLVFPNGDDPNLSVVSSQFTEQEFSSNQIGNLREEMQMALIDDGLYADEAAALLNTWELSYFLSPGQRLFFLVPQEWTDAVLPLRLSIPADVRRVMVGRIELVTPRQRELIREMANSSVPDLTTLLQRLESLRQDPIQGEAYNALASGRGDSSILGVPVPPIYQAFLDLGRFRTPLLMDALRRDRQSGTHGLDRVQQLQFELLHPGQLKRD